MTRITLKHFLQSCVLFIVVLAVFWHAKKPAAANLSDNIWYIPTSQSLLKDGNLELSEYIDEIRERKTWVSININGGWYNYFGMGTSILTLPLVWIGNHIYKSTHIQFERDRKIAEFAANIVAAITVSMLFLLVIKLTSKASLAFGLAGIFSFSTTQLSVHAGGLWSHCVVLPLVIAAFYYLFANNGRRAWIATIFLSFAYITRPTMALPLVVTIAYIYINHREQFWRTMITGLLIVLVFVGISKYSYGTILPLYYLGDGYSYAFRTIGYNLMPEALLGNLVSPNRGILIYIPITIFSIIGGYLSFRHKDKIPHYYRYLAILILLHWLLISTYPHWWGGYSFGPRFFSDMLPAFMLLLIPFWQHIGGWLPWKRYFIYGAVIILVGWGVYVNSRGAFCYGPTEWNVTPSVDAHPERIWEWSDMQALRKSTTDRW